MTVLNIPTRTQWTCDVPDCGQRVEVTPGAKPKHWATIVVAKDAYDFQGQAVADATVKRTLCAECSEGICKLINAYRRPVINRWQS